ncbi:3-hydroxyisobutyrate dehydrogenase, NAD-binding domain [Phytophthora cactorum]|nr:3-hydroxyisobutyrate dehydrogenase, NAD-binding domain [Phytophthora cactorum]
MRAVSSTRSPLLYASAAMRRMITWSSHAKQRVGFIGLGQMGGRMADNLRKHGHKLVVCDPVPANVQRQVDRAPRPPPTPERWLSSATPSSPCCHPPPPSSASIWAKRRHEALRSEHLLLDSSTIDPIFTKKLSKELHDRGATFVDAPVSGGVAGLRRHVDVHGITLTPALYQTYLRPKDTKAGLQCSHAQGFRPRFVMRNECRSVCTADELRAQLFNMMVNQGNGHKDFAYILPTATSSGGDIGTTSSDVTKSRDYPAAFETHWEHFESTRGRSPRVIRRSVRYLLSVQARHAPTTFLRSTQALRSTSVCRALSTVSSKDQVGVIGLGQMGGRMADNLRKHGHKLVVCDPVPANVQRQVDQAPRPPPTPERWLSSATPHHHAAIHRHRRVRLSGRRGVHEALRSEHLLLDSSTIDPIFTKKLSKELHDRGATFVDAPVSGGVAGAQNGTLTFMVGGEPEEFERVKRFEGDGQEPGALRGSSTGQVAKLCNNLALAIQMASVAEAMNLGTTLGIDPKILKNIMDTPRPRAGQLSSTPVPGFDGERAIGEQLRRWLRCGATP